MKITTLASLAACALMVVACSAPTQNDKAMNSNEECLICGARLEYLQCIGRKCPFAPKGE